MHRPLRSVSIAARDAASGELGYAALVDGFAPRTGQVRPGVGVAVAQGFADATVAAKALDALAAGQAPDAVIAALGDAPRVQLGLVDAAGRGAAHTGEGCVAQATHHHGDNFAAQASATTKSAVVPAMVSKWEGSAGRPLPERLVDCLAAAIAAGGDLRGQRAATLLVTQPAPERRVDLHVYDHDAPVDELARLLSLFRAAEHAADAEAAIARGDHAAAIGFLDTARELDPDDAELRYRLALLHAATGDDLRATAAFRRLFGQSENYEELTRRLADVGVLEEELVAKIMSAAE